MPRHAAFLRGVSPMNCKMPELRAAFEAASFSDVKTVLASGNVVFSASGSRKALKKKAEAAMEQHLGQAFTTYVRAVDELQALLDADPFQAWKLPANAKKIVTFLADGASHDAQLPLEVEQAHILAVDNGIALGAYVPRQNDPAFMRLIQRTFGKDVTTRTWETVRKVCAAAASS